MGPWLGRGVLGPGRSSPSRLSEVRPRLIWDLDPDRSDRALQPTLLLALVPLLRAALGRRGGGFRGLLRVPRLLLGRCWCRPLLATLLAVRLALLHLTGPGPSSAFADEVLALLAHL